MFKRGNAFNIGVVVLLVIALFGAFISGVGVTGKVVKDTCFEGTKEGKCSLVKPKYCDRGALKPNCQKCGCPAEQECLENGECIPKCSDGTLFGKCSEDQPSYCFRGKLVENCHQCGCYDGGNCEADGKCSGIRVRRCSDGTRYGGCSVNKPKYCSNGELIDRCGFCGCYGGMDCEEEKCVEEEQEIIVVGVEEDFEEEIDIVEEPEKEVKDIKWVLQWFCEVLNLRC